MGTLTRSELEAEIRASLGNRTDLNSRLPRILNMTQDLITRIWPWSELEDSVTGTTVDGTKTITFSTRNRDVYSFLLLDGTRSRKVKYIPLRLWDKKIPYPEQYTEGRPEFYTSYGSTLEMWRIPDDAYSYIIRRVKWPTNFTSASDVASDLEHKDDIIIALAVSYAFRTLGNIEKADSWGRTGGFGLKQAIEEDEGKSDYAISAEYISNISDDYWLNPWVRDMP